MVEGGTVMGVVILLCEGPERRFRATDKAGVLRTAEGITVTLVKGSIVTQTVR